MNHDQLLTSMANVFLVIVKNVAVIAVEGLIGLFHISQVAIESALGYEIGGFANSSLSALFTFIILCLLAVFLKNLFTGGFTKHEIYEWVKYPEQISVNKFKGYYRIYVRRILPVKGCIPGQYVIRNKSNGMYKAGSSRDALSAAYNILMEHPRIKEDIRHGDEFTVEVRQIDGSSYDNSDYFNDGYY